MYILEANMYILEANMYIFEANVYILEANVYFSEANLEVVSVILYTKIIFFIHINFGSTWNNN